MLISFYSTEPGIVMAATVEFFLGLELAMSEDPSEYQMRRPGFMPVQHIFIDPRH